MNSSGGPLGEGRVYRRDGGSGVTDGGQGGWSTPW